MLPNDVSICTHFFPPGERLTKANNRMMGPPGRRCAAEAESQLLGEPRETSHCPNWGSPKGSCFHAKVEGGCCPGSSSRHLQRAEGPAGCDGSADPGTHHAGQVNAAHERMYHACKLQTTYFIYNRKNLTSCNPSVNKIYLEPHRLRAHGSSPASCVKWDQISNLPEVVM